MSPYFQWEIKYSESWHDMRRLSTRLLSVPFDVNSIFAIPTLPFERCVVCTHNYGRDPLARAQATTILIFFPRESFGSTIASAVVPSSPHYITFFSGKQQRIAFCAAEAISKSMLAGPWSLILWDASLAGCVLEDIFILWIAYMPLCAFCSQYPLISNTTHYHMICTSDKIR